jgi:alkanesulfonate monooxygenase SsuD/methylene tetrahydromethanopterin reductase-like flavin-dependent oxidoreductase (luciferase family)
MFEAVDVIKKLFAGSLAGRDVRHSGQYFKLESTRLWTMPAVAPQIFVAASGPVTARRAGRNVDGLITTGAPTDRLAALLTRFAEGAREGGRDPSKMPKVLQLHLSWAATDEEAMRNALVEWPNGGMRFARSDIRSPFEFEQLARTVRAEDFEGQMVVSADPDVHRADIQRHLDLGFDRVYLHNVGRNQAEFLEVFGREVLPALRA